MGRLWRVLKRVAKCSMQILSSCLKPWMLLTVIVRLDISPVHTQRTAVFHSHSQVSRQEQWFHSKRSLLLGISSSHPQNGTHCVLQTLPHPCDVDCSGFFCFSTSTVENILTGTIFYQICRYCSCHGDIVEVRLGEEGSNIGTNYVRDGPKGSACIRA